MERDFRYLRDEHGDAGARELFEKICTQLMHARYGSDAHNIRVSHGDEGIDILVGDFLKPIELYQCKFFLDGIADSQKAQIRQSFQAAIQSEDYQMSKWILCVPCCLSAKEFKWWSEWKGEKQKIHGIEMELYDGQYLLSELKRHDIYNQAFDNETQQKLDEILKHLNGEKERLSEEIIVMLGEIEPDDFKDMLFVKKLENAKISMIDGCKRDYYNAEFAEYAIKSKGNNESIRMLNNLKQKVYGFWETQFRRYANEEDGNELITRVYERIEDADTQALGVSALPEVSLGAKKGMLHQWAEDCSIGWLKDYIEKLKLYLERGEDPNGD